jgi:hypothetical protein
MEAACPGERAGMVEKTLVAICYGTANGNFMARAPNLTRESAETVAIQALTFLADDQERLHRFLSLTGIEPESLRAAAREPNFLLGVLDHLAADETLLRSFADQQDILPETITQARDLLAGAPPEAP